MLVSAKLQEVYPTLNKARRRIADCILAEPEQFAFLSLQDLADKSDCAQLTVLHFLRDLGYKNFLDFKQQIQTELIEKLKIHERISIAMPTDNGDEALYTRLVKSFHRSIDLTIADNPLEKLLAFTGRLIPSQRVYVVAHNITEKPARILTSHLIVEGCDARYLEVENEEEVKALLSYIPTKSVLVAYGITPYGKSTLHVCELAKQQGVPILSVTDRKDSPLAEAAEVALTCHVRSTELFNSLTPLMMLTEMLMIFISKKQLA